MLGDVILRVGVELLQRAFGHQQERDEYTYGLGIALALGRIGLRFLKIRPCAASEDWGVKANEIIVP